VRDAALDRNRFSGPLPGFRTRSGIAPQRGGLYCSQDIRAAIAELFHYSKPDLSRALIGRPKRLGVFEHRCFVSLRVVGELSVTSLDSSSPAMLRFFETLQRDAEVSGALAAARHEDLFAAVYAERDYAAARGLGLGLESNLEIDGVQVISARDYETAAGGQDVMRTGDNVMLFGLDQRIAVDKVRVESLHLVDGVPGGAELLVTHYARTAGSVFRRSGADRFMP
jgi:hypothetical protein